MEKNRNLGIIMALTAAICWGASGNFAEYMLTNSSMEANTYVLYRMLFSGLILVPYSIYILTGIMMLKNLCRIKKKY